MITVAEFLFGALVVFATLRDLIQTVVVPGGAHNPLRLARRLIDLTLPIQTRWRRREIGVRYAPLVLLTAFALWIALLVIGFGLMTHALRHQFDPVLADIGTAMYVAGSSLATIGTGNEEPAGLAAHVTVLAGLAGLASMTMAVTYALEVQSTIHERDRGVLKLCTSTGDPPSGLALLERYAEIGCRDELADILRMARDWCAAVMQTHASHPWLIYFRSPGIGTAWPTSLGALMDAALIAEMLIDDREMRGLGALTRRQAQMLAGHLASLVHLDASPAAADDDVDIAALLQRLDTAGYRLRPAADVARFADARRRCIAPVDALCRHIGAQPTELLPAPEQLPPA